MGNHVGSVRDYIHYVACNVPQWGKFATAIKRVFGIAYALSVCIFIFNYDTLAFCLMWKFVIYEIQIKYKK